MLRNEKILLTGPTSQVALPLARALANDNEVVGLARLSKSEDRETLTAMGVTPHPADLATDDFSTLPDDFTYVLNFAVVRTDDFDHDLAANAEGLGRLMSRCRNAKALLHSSSAAVYEIAGDRALTETDPLGDNHRCMMPTYSIAKIAAESMARFVAREWNIPTTIARFSVPYGDNGGWPWYHLMMMKGGVPIPVHESGNNVFNLIHEDDYIAQVPGLLEIASVPATIVNWASHEMTSIEQWCGYLGELTGLEPKFAPSDAALHGLPLDTTRLQERVGPTRVGWKEGLRRMVQSRNPELLGEQDQRD
jgi:nucleoside-diphosphate-sugar epimerase